MKHQRSQWPRLRFSRDGRWLAGTCDDGACVWEAATGRKLGKLLGPYQPVALSFGGPKSEWLAVAWFHGATKLYRTAD